MRRIVVAYDLVCSTFSGAILSVDRNLLADSNAQRKI